MITGINHITLAVTDLDRSVHFYGNLLGLPLAARWEGGAYFTAGDIWVALIQDASAREAIRPDYSHLAFSCGSDDFSDLKARLISYGSHKWSENESEGESFYFLDPDGHKLEIHVGDLRSRLRAFTARTGPASHPMPDVILRPRGWGKIHPARPQTPRGNGPAGIPAPGGDGEGRRPWPQDPG